MGWSIGYDSNHKRDIGYGVPAYCDHPECNEEIDRGLSYVCGGEPYGGEFGCGLHFCAKHLCYGTHGKQLCDCCLNETGEEFTPKPDHPDWIQWKLTDESWAQWRAENPEWVAAQSATPTDRKEGDMRIIKNWPALIAAIYVSFSVITFGHSYTRSEHTGTQREAGALMAATFWPFYWSIQAWK